MLSSWDENKLREVQALCFSSERGGLSTLWVAASVMVLRVFTAEENDKFGGSRQFRMKPQINVSEMSPSLGRVG